jgi:hypothetical protein
MLKDLPLIFCVGYGSYNGDVVDNASFSCDKAALLRDTIKGTPCVLCFLCKYEQHLKTKGYRRVLTRREK